MTENTFLNLNKLRPAVQFLQYQLLEEIGVGGQGVVWSALDRTHNRIVALKLAEVSESDELKFQDLAFGPLGEQLALLRHPNILPLYDFGLSQGIRYLASPFIPGGSLQERLVAGVIPLGETLDIAAGIGAGLDYLHSQNMIHRDLKPGNVLMDLSRNVYVSDFGLSRFITDSTRALHTGHGTPPYSPPEQHSLAEITTQSDIFSFGILLFELFTGKLPWNAEKSLGVQQLYSHEELPDPREIDPNLPALLVKALRRMTAANPAARPKTASECLQMLSDVFNIPAIQSRAQRAPGASLPQMDAQILLKRAMKHWEPSEGTIPLTLTKFALLGLAQKQNQIPEESTKINRFMLSAAMAYGYDIDFWWKKIQDPRERLSIANSLINRDNEILTSRVVQQVLRDPSVCALKTSLSQNGSIALLHVAARTADLTLKENILEILRILTPSPAKWQNTTLGTESDKALAALALDDSPLGDAAAQLIGHLRSAQAVKTLYKQLSQDRRAVALLKVYETAGNLPAVFPAEIQIPIVIEWMFNRLVQKPMRLLTVYGMIALGVTLGGGLHVYLTYRLPTFMDIQRITIATERGLFMGIMLGFGIFVSRLIVEQYPEAKPIPRTALATLAGTALLSATLLLYDVLFLNTLPNGVLFIGGGMLVAFGFALSGNFHSRIIKMAFTGLAIFIALAASWYGHVLLAGSSFSMTPVFFYEYTWAPIRVLAVMLATTLPMAILGNLFSFNPLEK